MPLVHLGNLKGLTPLQQGRKIFEDYDRYGGGVVGYLSGRHPEYSPQASLFSTLHSIGNRRPLNVSHEFVRTYEDIVDWGLIFATSLMRCEITKYLESIGKKTEDVAIDVAPRESLFISFVRYLIIEESITRRMESRNPLYKTERDRLPLEKIKEWDGNVLSVAFASHSSLQKASKSFPRDGRMKQLLKSAELFPAYISEAYFITV